jgi:predicted nucleic acid-binding protein
MVDFYVDTSALLKRYRFEQGSAAVASLFQHRSAKSLIVSSHFTAVEAIGVLARMRKGRLLRALVYQRLVTSIVRDAGTQFQLLDVNATVVSRAVDLASTHALTGGDALQLGSAILAASSSSNLVFVCSDNHLADAASTEGLQVVNPVAADAVDIVTALLS